MQSEPRSARTPVWALSISLAATLKIEFSFSSSGYLDVSVHRVPSVHLWIQCTVTEVCSAGFPHSEICGSRNICFSPQLIAACHVLRRLSVPRHPPCALYSLTFIRYIALYLTAFFDFHHFGLFLGLAYLIVYAAPRMSKHYLKQCFIRYFNMQFSKNNVVSDFIIIHSQWR